MNSFRQGRCSYCSNIRIRSLNHRLWTCIILIILGQNGNVSHIVHANAISSLIVFFLLDGLQSWHPRILVCISLLCLLLGGLCQCICLFDIKFGKLPILFALNLSSTWRKVVLNVVWSLVYRRYCSGEGTTRICRTCRLYLLLRLGCISHLFCTILISLRVLQNVDQHGSLRRIIAHFSDKTPSWRLIATLVYVWNVWRVLIIVRNRVVLVQIGENWFGIAASIWRQNVCSTSLVTPKFVAQLSLDKLVPSQVDIVKKHCSVLGNFFFENFNLS